MFLAGCDMGQFGTGTSGTVTRPSSSRTGSPVAVAQTSRRVDQQPFGNQAASTDSRKEAAPAAAPVKLIGLGEQELRELLGEPMAAEERPPGKIWRYRKGRCTLNLSLYPDVQTRKFGTLTYEVKSDDDTDEGRRLCLDELRSRNQTR